MESPNPHASGPSRLKTLMKAAGLKSWRLDATRRGLTYCGRSREWLLVARLNDEWFHLYTMVCELPPEAGLRARLCEAAMAANGSLTLAKFGATTHLYLEIDYRAEHLDPSVLGNLAAYLYNVAEERFPKIFRIACGDETLAALAGSFDVPEVAA